MIPSNPVPQVCNYGTSATYRDLPNEEQLRNGVVPLDSLPAAWWNCMWNMTNGAINCARYAAGVLIDEVNTVLTRAGVCVNCGCVDQLYQAIDKIRQTIGTASVAGAVKSSSTASEVAIDPTTGIMSVNCLGNAASLTTTASTVVGAINELKSTYDTCWSNNTTALSGKAPTNHASSANTYGVGSASNYGHLKISDIYNDANCQGTDIAASQKAVYCAWKVASDAAAGNISLGNTNGCALGTASAGTATTAARSDHVHPIPTCVLDKYNANQYIGIGYSCPGLTCAQVTHLAAFSSNYATNCVVIKDAPKAVIQSWLGLGSAAYTASTAYLAASGCAADSKLLTGKAPSALCVARAGANGSGVAFGTAAVYNIRTGGSVTYIPYSGADANCVLTGNFLAYWNGAYNSSGSSNFLYTAVGKLQSAAACAATAFRASDWWPNSMSCGCVYKATWACSANWANCAAYVYEEISMKGKWCCICSPGSGICCVRLYVCNASAGDYIIFPGSCFTYIPQSAYSYVSAPAQPVSISSANINKWVAIGPTYAVSHLNNLFPACTTTGTISYLVTY